MLVKLTSSIAGDRFSYRPRQVVECSDRTGARLIEAGIATGAAAGTPAEGALYDSPPSPDGTRTPRVKERAVLPTPKKPEAEAVSTCAGKTTAGNACRKRPLPGKRLCAKHTEDL